MYITKVYVLIFITDVFSELTVRGLEFYSDSHFSFKDTARYIKNCFKYLENHVVKISFKRYEMYLGTLQFFTNLRL